MLGSIVYHGVLKKSQEESVGIESIDNIPKKAEEDHPNKNNYENDNIKIISFINKKSPFMISILLILLLILLLEMLLMTPLILIFKLPLIIPLIILLVIPTQRPLKK
jgi:hypothetical protein